jgi:hypothetical protein
VAAAGTAPEIVSNLKAAFAGAATRPWFAPLGDALLLEGFAPVDQASFAVTLAWDTEALASGYPAPA